jgi:hypothetical protein
MLRSRAVTISLPVRVFLLALVVNGAWLVVDRELTSDDSPTYIGPAVNLAQGRGFTNVNGLPETRRTPGYPLFLAPFFFLPASLVLATIAQVILNAAVAAGVACEARNLSGHPLAAAIAGAVFIADISSLHYASQILTETLFTALVFAAYRLLPRRALLAGLVGGAAVLVRPIGLYLFVPVAAALLLRREPRRVVRALVFSAAFLILPFVWSERNARAGAGRTISTITSWSILFDRAAGTLALERPGPFGHNVNEVRLELAARVGEPFAATYSNHVPHRGEVFHPERYTRVGLEVLTGHPLAYLRAWLRALAYTMFGGGARLLEDFFGIGGNVARGMVLLYTVPLVLLAGAGAMRMLIERRDEGLLLAAIVTYLLVTCSIAEPNARFRVPMMPFLAIWCGAAVTWLRQRVVPAPSA